MSNFRQSPDSLQPIRACTVSRDVQAFGLLVEDMETALGDAWGDLSLAEAAIFLRQPEAETLEFVSIAVDDQDETQGNLPKISNLIRVAKETQIRVILIAGEISPIALHELLRLGADDFVPYPLPEGALNDAIARIAQKSQPTPITANTTATHPPDTSAMVLAVQGISGGMGATNLAVNLAWELALGTKQTTPRVCLLDLDLQFGGVATYLDLPRRDQVYEFLADLDRANGPALTRALLSASDTLHVLTAPAEILPIDILSPENVEILINLVRADCDFVVIDMPRYIVSWTETVLKQADRYFAVMGSDMRSGQNAMRMIRLLKAEEQPIEKLCFVLNRAPSFTNLNARAHVKRLAESLMISFDLRLPDGGDAVTKGNDSGLPLAQSAPKNPLRKEIRKAAHALLALQATGRMQAATTKRGT